MQCPCRVVLLLLCAVAVQSENAGRTGASVSVTPIAKVLEMLSGLLEKSKAEMQAEKVRWTEAAKWCEMTEAEKDKIIKAQGTEIVRLTAAVDMAQSDASNAQAEIDYQNGMISGWKQQQVDITAQRKAANEAYITLHTDFSESIDALDGAIKVLKAREKDVPQSLLQIRKVGESAHDSAPEANAYEFQSGAIVEMLEKLRLRFIKERREDEQQEMEQKFNYNLLMQKTTDNIDQANGIIERKTILKAERIKDEKENQAALTETTKAKEAEEHYRTDMKALCSTKAQEFESRATLRGEEIEALKKAIEIISSQAVAGNGKKYLPSFSQAKQGGVALVQSRSTSSHSEAKKRVASLLAEAAAKAKSPLLAMVATHASEDPFAKVKKMISDLIAKLQAEAQAELDHKQQCDLDVAGNTLSRETQEGNLATTQNNIAETKGKIATHADTIANLNDEIAALDAAKAEAETARAAEEAENSKTIEDAKAAQEAVQSAETRLKTFYENAATATAFAQRQTPAADMPETFDKPYQGAQATSVGIIGMLEVIEADFKRLEDDTAAAESAAASQHATFLTDTANERAAKLTTLNNEEYLKSGEEEYLENLKEQETSTKEMLKTLYDSWEALKASCVDTGLSYKERKMSREEEVKSLKEALAMLTAEELGGF